MEYKNIIKPFLRWAGGKSWMIKYLDEIIQNNKFNNYHELFLGGGAVFFATHNYNNAYLSDINKELINTYIIVRDLPYDLIDILKGYENTEEFYYEIRNKKYRNKVHKAARFLYLNQTSYNGLYRENLKGEYNVPFGYRTKIFLDQDKILLASNKLQNVNIRNGDFMEFLNDIEKDDLIFLDPPYIMNDNMNGFIKYNKNVFSMEKHYNLSLLIDIIKTKGAYYILTNSVHEKNFELFNKNDKVFVLDRANLIGGENANRNHVQEYIFTNIKEG